MQTLTDFLEREDFEVERSFVVETGFRATYGSEGGLNVCVICEYDALPGIGHGCGHNLIAECGVAAGIGIKAALEEIGGVDAMVRDSLDLTLGQYIRLKIVDPMLDPI